MKNVTKIAALLICLTPSLVFAGYFSSNYDRSSSVAVTIEVIEKGLFNLVVAATIVAEPYEKEPYDTDKYEQFVKRINSEWKGVAVHKILETSSIKLDGLNGLRAEIKSDVLKTAEALKSAYGIPADTELAFKITGFYLVNLNNE